MNTRTQVVYELAPRPAPPLEPSAQSSARASLRQSFSAPLLPSTHHLIGETVLKVMKPTAYLINTARGEICQEEALIAALQHGKIAGAGLDVFENEPNLNPRLKALRNVVVLPHMSSATLEGRIDMGEKVIINIKTFIDGHRPPDRVLPSML